MIATTAPVLTADCPGDEFRLLAALEGMAGLETLLETLDPQAQLPAVHVLGLVRAVHAAARDVLLWQPRDPVNDNA
jgi:hypothetical protein